MKVQPSPVLAMLNEKKIPCSGCGACNLSCPVKCIKMEADVEGFLYPYLNTSSCIHCGICTSICPILTSNEQCNTMQLPLTYACINKNIEIREKSSSGGIFTILAEKIIDMNGVVFGAKFSEDFLVVHDYSENREGIAAFRGSKYTQSNIADSFVKVKFFLDLGRMVLFSGTPCQIGGLKSFLIKEYENLFCIDIICHGVPSPKVWQKYIAYREKIAGSKTQRISFRRKDCGWKLYSISFNFVNETEYIANLQKDLYMQFFLTNLSIRPSCYNCSFKQLKRQADITLADFWGVENVCPEMFDDKGTSLVMLQSAKGFQFFNDVSYRLWFTEVVLHEAIRFNSSAIESVKKPKKRASFFDDINNNNIDLKHIGNKYLIHSYYRKFLGLSKRLINRVIKKIFHN